MYVFLLLFNIFFISANTSMLSDDSTGLCPYCHSMDLNYNVKRNYITVWCIDPLDVIGNYNVSLEDLSTRLYK